MENGIKGGKKKSAGMFSTYKNKETNPALIRKPKKKRISRGTKEVEKDFQYASVPLMSKLEAVKFRP